MVVAGNIILYNPLTFVNQSWKFNMLSLVFVQCRKTRKKSVVRKLTWKFLWKICPNTINWYCQKIWFGVFTIQKSLPRLAWLETALFTVGWSLLHSSKIEKIPPQTCPYPTLMEVIPPIEVPTIFLGGENYLV